MKKNMIVLLVTMALLVGILSGCTEEETPTNNAPEASFTSEVNETTKTATFTDASTDADDDNLTYSWDFGDEQTSTEQNPAHTYAENGTYTVKLTVDDGTTTDEHTATIKINVVEPAMPVATFTYDPMVNITNTTEITFTSSVTMGDATNLSYMWDFGDETNSTLENPTHTYAENGTYEVALTVTDVDDSTLTDISDTVEIVVGTTE